MIHDSNEVCGINMKIRYPLVFDLQEILRRQIFEE